MSTAVADPSAPARTDAPVDMLKALYGHPSSVPAAKPDGQPPSEPHPEPGPAVPPSSETTAPAGEVKPDPQKEAEAEHAKAEAEKVKAEESQRQAARRLGKQVQELETQLKQLAEENKVLQAKVNGTYEEPQQPTAEQIAAQAEFAGREMASRDLAFQKYGEDKVLERIYQNGSEYDQLRQRQPWYQMRVMQSAQPTLEAWTVLEEHAFKGKYGNDPTQWVAKIIAEARPAIVDEIKKTLNVTPTGAPAPSVTQARGDGGPSTKVKSLAEMMYPTMQPKPN